MSSPNERFEQECRPNIGGDSGRDGNPHGAKEPMNADAAQLLEELAAFLRAADAGLENDSPEGLMETGSSTNEVRVVSIDELTAAAEQIANVLPVLFRYTRNRPEDVQSFLKGLVNSFYIRVVKPEL